MLKIDATHIVSMPRVGMVSMSFVPCNWCRIQAHPKEKCSCRLVKPLKRSISQIFYIHSTLYSLAEVVEKCKEDILIKAASRNVCPFRWTMESCAHVAS